MAKILVTDGIEKSAAEELTNMGHSIVEQFYTPDELRVQVKDFDAVIVRSATKVTKEVIDGALETGRLKLIIRGGVGVDNIDVPYAEANGIAVANTPNASSLAVAELAIGHMFALARYIYISNVSMRDGKWDKKKYEGIELSGKTLGLIGFGRIARETAKLAKAIGMKVIYNTRSGRKEGYDEFDYVPLEELLGKSDFISLHIPYDKKQGTLIGPGEFEKMKKGVFLVNCARGGVLDEEALLAALDSGRVAAAALDVYEQEPTPNVKLYTHGNVCLTPHIGASTIEAQERIGKEIVEIIKTRLN
ncbi:MAG TPA: D-2-hydroxyacid dehydrogenase [Anaerovoracaceae bacterium]|nr:D-2-hydroxyacid dehydrogenase [Anaerovoracaceae bacterium]